MHMRFINGKGFICAVHVIVLCVCFSKFIQDKYSGYSQKEAAYIAGAVYDSSLVLSAAVGILIVSQHIQYLVLTL